MSNVRTADPTKAPEGKGWVVEVHGTTYHKDPQDFIRDTLMDNIYRLSLKDGQPPAAATPATPAATPVRREPPSPPM